MVETESLSLELRNQTAQAHRAAEGSSFMGRFISGRLTRAEHINHLLALHGVYRALEKGLEQHRDDGRIGRFYLPELWRTPAIEADLEFLTEGAWTRSRPVEAGRDYETYLEDLTASRPLLLVAHAYVRYLGDLSGGQMLKPCVAKALDLVDDGIRFYEFPEIPNPGKFKADFRSRLDALELDADERRALVEEANTAFDLNGRIFRQLDSQAS